MAALPLDEDGDYEVDLDAFEHQINAAAAANLLRFVSVPHAHALSRASAGARPPPSGSVSVPPSPAAYVPGVTPESPVVVSGGPGVPSAPSSVLEEEAGPAPASPDPNAAVWPILNALKLIQKVYQVRELVAARLAPVGRDFRCPLPPTA